MRQALMFNAGAGWAAYQVGAAEHLVDERHIEFDAFAGCGIGAMNAAFLACGRLRELGAFWESISTWKLVRPNLRSAWRAPLINRPQRAFVERYVDEQTIAERGTELAITTFDLWTGEELVHRYPRNAGTGADRDLPLVDAIMAAVATPGLVRPIEHGDRLLAEATLVNSVPAAALEQLGPLDRVVAVLAGMPLDGGPARRYETWRAVTARALELNLGHDVDQAITSADAATKWRIDVELLADDVGSIAGSDQPDLRQRILTAVAPLLDEPAPPEFVAIVPSAPLGYPLWRFPASGIRRARELGRSDAAAAQ